MKLKQKIVVIFACALSFMAVQAQASPILTFGQLGGGTPIIGTNLGGIVTTITGVNVDVGVTQLAAPAVIPFVAQFSFGAVSTGPAVAGPGGQGAVQNFSGTFCITSLDNCAGVNYLSGVFTDVALGAGSSMILAASQPPDIVNFTSSVIPANLLVDPSALALSFAGVVPPVSIVGSSIGSFVSSVSGTFSAEQVVPEPASLSLLGLGLVLAARLRKRPRA